jgi:hypothetical protein
MPAHTNAKGDTFNFFQPRAVHGWLPYNWAWVGYVDTRCSTGRSGLFINWSAPVLALNDTARHSSWFPTPARTIQVPRAGDWGVSTPTSATGPNAALTPTTATRLLQLDLPNGPGAATFAPALGRDQQFTAAGIQNYKNDFIVPPGSAPSRWTAVGAIRWHGRYWQSLPASRQGQPYLVRRQWGNQDLPARCYRRNRPRRRRARWRGADDRAAGGRVPAPIDVDDFVGYGPTANCSRPARLRR